nr:transposase (putative), gypsy type [Tanacetum cinerariifolium]
MQRSRIAYRLPLPVTPKDRYRRDTVQLETVVSTISQEYLLEFTSKYGISEDLHPELPGPEERIVDFSEGKISVYTKFFEFANFRLPLLQFLFDILGHYQIHLSQLLAYKCSKGRDASRGHLFPEGCDDTKHTSHPHLKTTRSTAMFSRVEMEIFPERRRTGTHPRAAHEVPLLTVTASRVIKIKDPSVATNSSGVPSTIERSPLDFANENASQQSTREAGLAEETAAMGLRVIKERHKWGNDGVDTNVPPKVLRRDHANFRPTQSTIGGKSLAAMGLGMGSSFPVPTSQDTHVDVSDPGPLSFANPQSIPTENVAQYAKISYSSVFNSDLPRERPLLEIQNRRIPPSPSWSGHPKAFISQSGLRLWFEQEAKLLKKSVAQVARRDHRIQARENKIKNLEALLEAETDMKKTTEAKNAKLGKELENLRALFSDLQVRNDQLSQQRCAEMDAHLDALSIDFDEELYPHMLTAIAGHRWVIGHRLRLAVMKCGESTELRQVFTDVVSVGIAKGLAILLEDAATQMETSKDGASPSVSCAPWESSRMHLTS